MTGRWHVYTSLPGIPLANLWIFPGLFLLLFIYIRLMSNLSHLYAVSQKHQAVFLGFNIRSLPWRHPIAPDLLPLATMASEHLISTPILSSPAPLHTVNVNWHESWQQWRTDYDTICHSSRRGAGHSTDIHICQWLFTALPLAGSCDTTCGTHSDSHSPCTLTSWSLSHGDGQQQH